MVYKDAKFYKNLKKINNCSYFSMLSLKELNKFHMKVGKRNEKKRNLCKDRKSDLREAEGITHFCLMSCSLSEVC